MVIRNVYVMSVIFCVYIILISNDIAYPFIDCFYLRYLLKIIQTGRGRLSCTAYAILSACLLELFLFFDDDIKTRKPIFRP